MVLFHRQADRPVVDDRNHFAQVLGEQAVKQHLIAVVQRGQINVLAERVRQALVLSVGAGHLRLQGADHRRKEAGESQRLPLLRRECGSFVQTWSGEHGYAARLGFMTTHLIRGASA